MYRVPCNQPHKRTEPGAIGIYKCSKSCEERMIEGIKRRMPTCGSPECIRIYADRYPNQLPGKDTIMCMADMIIELSSSKLE